MAILEIREKNLDLSLIDLKSPEGSTLDKPNRKAVRAVLMDDQNNVAVLFVKKFGYHKLPGGGIEPGENEKKALGREINEEVGCEAEITGEIGEIIEYRDQYGQKQTSKAFLARVVGQRDSSQAFTTLEQSQGFELQWLPIDQALNALSLDNPLNYEGVFIKQRDTQILLWAQQALGK